jgi:hypothetical protein
MPENALFYYSYLPYFDCYPNHQQRHTHSKVFGRLDYQSRISIGNHTLDDAGDCVPLNPVFTQGAHYNHYPFRSRDQMAAKIKRQAEMFRPIDPNYRLCLIQDAIDDQGLAMVNKLWKEIENAGPGKVPAWISGDAVSIQGMP